tara:strand:- start:58 stop:915 length:858 start_codon:yes stop_codon:yes gene_type:complete
MYLKIISHIFVSQFIFFLKHNYNRIKIALENNKPDYFDALSINGFVHIKKCLSEEEVNNFFKLIDIKNSDQLESIIEQKTSENSVACTIYNRYSKEKFPVNAVDYYQHLPQIKMINNLVSNYLGKPKLVAIYENEIMGLGKYKSSSGAMQPHHDNKFNRIKVYLCLSRISDLRHPLFYLKGSHLKFKLPLNYSSTRYPLIPKDNMEKIKMDLGDIVIFDTHGIHSHMKDFGLPRAVYNYSIDPNYYYITKSLLNKFLKNVKGTLYSITHDGATKQIDNLDTKANV